MIRVLHMIASLNVGGSQAMVMNLYRNIDHSKIQFDFIIDHADHLFFAEEVKSLGGKIYTLPTFKGTNLFQIRKAWKSFFKSHPEYKILHSHSRSYASIYIPIAKKFGLKTIIHSHSTSEKMNFAGIIKRCLEYPLRYTADYLFACSSAAGVWLYGKKATKKANYFCVPNAVNINEFKYDKKIRALYRKDLNLTDKLVFGHVGRLHESKNHAFLLELFKKIHVGNSNSVLILVGDGPLRKSVEDKIKSLSIENNVLLLGNRSDVANLMQSMDVFLFPSLWEGLPVTVVEAQASGLPCLVSNNVTSEVKLSDSIHFLPINQGHSVWLEAISKVQKDRTDNYGSITEAGYNIDQSIQWISEFYTKISD